MDNHPTRNRWVPVSCYDLKQPTKSPGTFYLGKYKVVFVFMVGWIERPLKERDRFYLNDRTGEEVVIKFAALSCEPSEAIGRFVKLFGVWRNGWVEVHNWCLQDRIPFDEEIALYYEAARIRENLLHGGLDNIEEDSINNNWINEYQMRSLEASSSIAEDLYQDTQEDKGYIMDPPIANILSLSRLGSTLALHPAFEYLPAIKTGDRFTSRYDMSKFNPQASKKIKNVQRTPPI